MIIDLNDTIAAIGQAPGPGKRGLVRLSGPRAWEVARSALSLTTEWVETETGPPTCRDGFLNVPAIHGRLPALLMTWRAPRSYTGQAIAEVHTIGNPAILQALLGHVLERGARPANPGEFTLRAFLAGKVDLTQAEAVLEVIDADSPARLEAALRQLAGGISSPILALRDRLIDHLAWLEANLDFVEEPDVEPWKEARMLVEFDESLMTLQRLVATIHDRDRRDDDCPKVVLTGPPNAGKSRLFNAMAGRDHAIVSPIAGTTRDYLATRVHCDGMLVELIDTAGEMAADDRIEEVAQRHRRDQLDQADLILSCRSGDTGVDTPESSAAPRIGVWTKSDRFPDVPEGFLTTSAATGEGLDELRQAIARRLGGGASEGSMPATTGIRCRGSLRSATDALESARETLSAGLGAELVAMDLRRAVESLGEVVGEVVTDDILDRIFGRFCIGK